MVLEKINAFLIRVLTLRNAIIAGVLLIVLLGMTMTMDKIVMPWYTKHGEALSVPNVVATPYDDAKSQLESLGLEVVKQGEKHDPKLPFGYVSHQNPRAERTVKKGRRIYLTLSIGEREVEIPNLVGLSETNAEETLKSLGLRLGDREYRYEPNELPKVVIEQSVAANSFVKLSRPVDIVVSLGRPVDNVTVPSVFGKMLDDAELIIKRSGMTLGALRYQMENNLMPNTVIGQSKESGTVVAPGDTLDLVLSTLNQRNN